MSYEDLSDFLLLIRAEINHQAIGLHHPIDRILHAQLHAKSLRKTAAGNKSSTILGTNHLWLFESAWLAASAAKVIKATFQSDSALGFLKARTNVPLG
jgi:hypothetical protein